VAGGSGEVRFDPHVVEQVPSDDHPGLAHGDEPTATGRAHEHPDGGTRAESEFGEAVQQAGTRSVVTGDHRRGADGQIGEGTDHREGHGNSLG
jgi:hypothetical protein